MRTLVVIPARGGSKGLIGKNIKPLAGKPLICWTIDAARGIADDGDICVSTDSATIAGVVENYGLKVPFMRPGELATDNATTVDVLRHALDFYERDGNVYDAIILLQPTSPLRTAAHIKGAIEIFDTDLDMVVSVKKSHAAWVICSENSNSYLEFTLNRGVTRRQDMNYWEYNGAVYVINVTSFKAAQGLAFEKVKKYVMTDIDSVDIDTQLDFDLAELIINRR